MQKNILESLVIYECEKGNIEFRFDFEKETFFANQSQIADVFGVNSQAITKHIKNIYKDKELEEDATCSVLEQVQKEGDRSIKRKIKVYNLDMIISVGYRINSKKGTTFRKWATKTLKQYITTGFKINQHQIKKNYQKPSLYLLYLLQNLTLKIKKIWLDSFFCYSKEKTKNKTLLPQSLPPLFYA